MSGDAAAFVRQCGRLPSLSPVYLELKQAVDDPQTSLDHIVAILRRDVGLASRLLKLANSAMYSFSSRVGTLEEAVQLIGLKEVRALALATCVIDGFKGIPAGTLSVGDFWRHSLACGVACSMLGECAGDPAPERLFVGGLLHDIGRLLLYVNAPDRAKPLAELYAAADASPCVVEQRVFGFDHATLGAELLGVWGLPSNLVRMVGQHHHPATAVGVSRDDGVVHCADFLVTALEIGASGEVVVSPLADEPARRWLPPAVAMEGFVDTLEKRCRELMPLMAA